MSIDHQFYAIFGMGIIILFGSSYHRNDILIPGDHEVIGGH